MQQNNNFNDGQKASLTMKKTWVKPDLEVIATDYIQSGDVGKGPEGQFTSGSFQKYHS